MSALGSWMKHAWNAFSQLDRGVEIPKDGVYGGSFGARPDRSRPMISNERSIIAAIYARLSIDIAAVALRHIRQDPEDRYIEDINSGLNECLKVEANLDQAASALRQDIALTLFDRGTAAIVPVDTTSNPETPGSWDIKTLRVGNVVAWHPEHVRIDLYNQKTGRREEITLEKRFVAIVDNPLYSVMNEPSSTLQRLLRKLSLLDAIDEQSASGKLDLIIQLPYVVKSEARREQAEQRRKDVEFQLRGNKYGIAYTDGTEKITQLNRPVENNLLKTIEFLTEMLYGQLGLTEEVMNGTADETAMINYFNRTIEPIVRAITEAMTRSFLTKTARSQGQTVKMFRNPFGLISVTNLAEVADKFTRNEVLTANDLRSILGIKPSKDPKADELRNSNMPQQPAVPAGEVGSGTDTE